MSDIRNDTMAQAVFLAQLEAAKNTCGCKTCQIMRKASEVMTEQFLQKTEAGPDKTAEVEALTTILSGVNK